MATISSTSGLGSTPSPTTGNDLRSVDLSKFLDLMIAELQNQDPLNPLDNTQLIQQISQIREIGATNQLSETLSAMQTGQNLTAASSLIGKQVSALNDDGQNVQGTIDRVTVEVDSQGSSKRSIKAHIGDSSFDLSNIREVEAASS
jgi:flagellar basal-body rod modification protein FlgD